VTDLLDAVLTSADARPADPAISFGRVTLSYGDLADRIRAVSSSLTALGMRAGDRVLFSVRPGPDAVVLALAIVHAGGCVVFADPGAGEALFRARAALAEPRWVAAESLLYLASSGPLRGLARRRGLELAPYRRVVPEARHIFAGPWLPGVPRGAVSLAALRRSAGRSTRQSRGSSGFIRYVPSQSRQTATFAEASTGGDPDDALVVFTSGTTEAPKAVVHTRTSLGAGLADFAAATGLRAGQRVLTDQLMVGVPALIAGAHWTMPPPRLHPGARPAEYLRRIRGTQALFAVPAALDAILRALDDDPDRTPELELLILGGAPVLRPLLERARARFPGATIRAVYGMTEILPVAIADGDEKLALARSAASSVAVSAGDFVGRVVPSVGARIDAGELVLTGPGMASRYLGEPPLGEIRTGDLAELDGDRLTLLGRAKDMFIRGTQNVYPGLYEPIIAGLPGVADAAMVGIPDAIGDERIVVAVVPLDPPAATDAGHPVAREVARALPGLVDAGALPDLVVAVPALPRSGRGRKLDRAALLEMLR
jgi:acyl-CoA synthetase (AMP-forming)/AMP-acid ligase II